MFDFCRVRIERLTKNERNLFVGITNFTKIPSRARQSVAKFSRVFTVKNIGCFYATNYHDVYGEIAMELVNCKALITDPKQVVGQQGTGKIRKELF